MANNRELSQFANVVGYNGGNIGIGTDNPGHNLEIKGSFPDFAISDSDTTNDKFRILHNSGQTQLQVDPNNVSGSSHLLIAIDGTERLRIDSSGRILQGLTSAKTGFFNDNNAPPVHQIQGSTYYNTAFSIFRDGSGASGPNFILAKGREAIVQDNDILGTISFQGHDGTTELIEGASIVTEVDGTPGANDVPSALVFKTNSGTSLTSERLRITSDGRIGINETSPDQLLHIKNNASAGYSAAIKLESSGTSNSANDTMGLIQFAHNDSNDAGVSASIVCKAEDAAGNTYLQFNNGNPSASSERLRITSTGRIGFNAANPPRDYCFHSGQADTNIQITNDTTGIDDSAGALIQQDGNDFYIWNKENSFMSLGTNASEKVRIAADGDLTHTGADNVEYKMKCGSSSGNNIIAFLNSSGTTRGNITYDSDNNFLFFNVNQAERVRIDANGYVTLKCNSSNLARLSFNHVNSTRIEYSDTSGDLTFYTNSAARCLVGYGGGFRPQVDNSQDLGLSSQRWKRVYAANGTIQTSDEREKTSIATSTLGSDFIKQLRPVSYKWNVGENIVTKDEDGETDVITPRPGERTHWGFIAQEVKQAADTAGVDFGGWILGDKDDPDSTQGLCYDQFIAPLTKALQEAIAKIETLETQNADLLARVTALEGS